MVQRGQLSSDKTLTSPSNTVANFAMKMKPLLIRNGIAAENLKNKKNIYFLDLATVRRNTVSVATPSLTSDGFATKI
jgi:hypothetical protein